MDDKLAPKSMRLESESSLTSRHGSIDIPWSPPTANWNTWTASRIERGYFATVFIRIVYETPKKAL